MAKVLSALTEEHQRRIRRQPMFFVATAPLSASGRVNLSPKGIDGLRILSPERVAWVDLVGSGAETIAHLRENGRLTIMLCAFRGPPRILRIYGRGVAHRPGAEGWDALAAALEPGPGARTIIELAVDRVAVSCGYGVPLFEQVGERSQLTDWVERKGEEGVARYIAANNRQSIDGLPAVEP